MARIIIALLAAVLLVGVAAAGIAAWPPSDSPPAGTPAPSADAGPPVALASATRATVAPPSVIAPGDTPTPPLPTPTPSATPIPAASSAAGTRAAQFQAIVQRYLGDLPGTFGVVVKDLKTGETFTMNGDQPFQTASLYKLWLMYEVYKQAEEGTLDLAKKMTIEPRHMSQSEFDEKLPLGLTVTIERSLWFLITLSSNSAAMALNDYVSWADVNRSLREAGFSQSRMSGDPGERRYGDWRDEYPSSTPNEILRFFELIYHRQLLSPAASDKMMFLLRNQQIHDRLSKKLPAGVVMAHKTGNLPGVINDVGIIFGPQTDLYVGVMSRGADYELTTAALQNLGLALYQAVN